MSQQTQEFEIDLGMRELQSLAAQTPWWLVSTLFHVFVLALVALVSVTMNLDSDEPLVTTTLVSPAVVLNTCEMSGRFVTTDCRIEVPPDFSGGPDLTPNPLDLHIDTLPAVGSGKWRDEKVKFAQEPLRWRSINQVSDGDAIEIGSAGSFGAGSWGHRRYACGFARKSTPNEAEKYFVSCFRPATFPSDWLAAHQEPDGHWDAVKYGAWHSNDTAVTALALLSLLPSDDSNAKGEFRDSIQRAVKWLIGRQKEDGSFAEDEENGSPYRRGGYPTAIATLALCEAARVAEVSDTRAAAQKAVDYCVNVHQSREGSERRAWRYDAKESGDLPVTGWFILALQTAKRAGLKVEAKALDGAARFLESVEVKEKSLPDGSPVSRFKYMPDCDLATSAHRLTAIGTASRRLLGCAPEELKGGTEWFIQRGGVPRYGVNGERVDFYYWYFGSIALRDQDTPRALEWYRAMRNPLLGVWCDDGSVKQVGEYSTEWGRVGQAAFWMMCARECGRALDKLSTKNGK